MNFTIGEEVLYDEERYVIGGVSSEAPLRYRLLSTTPNGARVIWANVKDVEKISSYTTAQDDTANY